MAWKPFIEPLGVPTDPIEDTHDFGELVFRRAMLAGLEGISDELRLLNARIEEAFNTKIEEGDV